MGPTDAKGPYTLPSGKIISAINSGALERPWEPQEIGAGHFVLVRQLRGDSSRLQYFTGGRRDAQIFDRADAEALAGIMNAALRRNPRVRRLDVSGC